MQSVLGLEETRGRNRESLKRVCDGVNEKSSQNEMNKDQNETILTPNMTENFKWSLRKSAPTQEGKESKTNLNIGKRSHCEPMSDRWELANQNGSLRLTSVTSP